jgi:hypothetical protein
VSQRHRERLPSRRHQSDRHCPHCRRSQRLAQPHGDCSLQAIVVGVGKVTLLVEHTRGGRVAVIIDHELADLVVIGLVGEVAVAITATAAVAKGFSNGFSDGFA